MGQEIKSDLTLEELLDFDFESYYVAKKLRHDRPWVYDIIRVLWGASASGMSMNFLCRNLWEMRNPSGLPMPREFGKTVQSSLNSHSAQSSRWNKRLEDDLFYSPKGKHSGTWAVHRNRAATWLNNHELPPA